MPYIGTQPKDVRSFGKVQFDFTATQGQTAFTGADDDGKTLGFTEGQIQVYVNGILMDASDYTTSNTNTVTLVSAANLNDIITVVALQTDIPNSDYVPISGGTFTGNVTFSGDATFTGTVTGTGSPSIDDNGDATAITIDSSENVLIGKTTSNTGNSLGFEARQNGLTNIGRDAGAPLILNRNTSDGDILLLRKDGTTKGQIDVNSNSVDYKTTGDSTGIDLTKEGLVGHGIELYNSSSASLTTTATTFVTNSGAPSALATGPYMLSVRLNGGGWYSETWSGIMQWYAGSTNSNDSSTITMTGAGHAPNGRVLYARFRRFGGNQHNHGLQLWTNSASSNHTIRIYATKLSRQGW